MDINTAIRGNAELIGELKREGRLEDAESVNLSNEALYRLQEIRRTQYSPPLALLPSETKE